MRKGALGGARGNLLMKAVLFFASCLCSLARLGAHLTAIEEGVPSAVAVAGLTDAHRAMLLQMQEFIREILAAPAA